MLQKMKKHKFVTAAFVLVCLVYLVVVIAFMCKPTSLRMNQLPLPAQSHLVGREDDIHMIEKRLQNDNYNTVFIVGPPGVGKSAVAIRIGYDFINKNLMEVLYVDMEDLEIGNFEKFMTDRLEGPENWPEKLSMKVLLVLDNCDKHTIDDESLRKLHKQIDKWLHDTTMLKVLITNQAKVQWPKNAPHLLLKYLRPGNTKTLLHQRVDLRRITAEYVTMLQGSIDGMPLAVENIVDYLQSSTSPGLPSLLSIFKKPNQAIKVFDPKHLVHVTHTVFKSISIAYNSIQDDDKECGCHLVEEFGAEEFDESAANTEFKQIGGTSNYDDCLSNLVQAQLLITKTETVKNVKEPDCMIQGTT